MPMRAVVLVQGSLPEAGRRDAPASRSVPPLVRWRWDTLDDPAERRVASCLLRPAFRPQPFASRSRRRSAAGPDEAGFWPVISKPSATT